MSDIRTDAFGTCPMCGGALSVVVDHAVPTDEQYPSAIMHTVPMCMTFSAMEPGAYLALVCNVRQAQRTPPVGDA